MRKSICSMLREIGARDAREGKPIEAFYDIVTIRHNEQLRAQYEIGYRSQKADFRRKSIDHVAFVGNFEYFFYNKERDLFGAPVAAPIQGGYRTGSRFECTQAALPLWKKVNGIE